METNNKHVQVSLCRENLARAGVQVPVVVISDDRHPEEVTFIPLRPLLADGIEREVFNTNWHSAMMTHAKRLWNSIRMDRDESNYEAKKIEKRRKKMERRAARLAATTEAAPE